MSSLWSVVHPCHDQQDGFCDFCASLPQSCYAFYCYCYSLSLSLIRWWALALGTFVSSHTTSYTLFATGPQVWNNLLADLRLPDLSHNRFRQSLRPKRSVNPPYLRSRNPFHLLNSVHRWRKCPTSIYVQKFPGVCWLCFFLRQ